MAVAQRADPCLAFRFKVEAGNDIAAGFSEVTGLTLETDLETFREGGANLYEQQLVGPTKYPARLVLKRGLTDVGGLWSWYQEIATGQIQRRNIVVSLLDSTGEVKQQWAFIEACPVKWVGPEFRGGSAEIAFETVELTHKGLLPHEAVS